MGGAGYLHKVSLSLEPSHRDSTLGSVAGVAFFGALAGAGLLLDAGRWPGSWPRPPVPDAALEVAVAVLGAVVALLLVATVVHGRRWRTYRRIVRLTRDPALEGYLPEVETESVGPFAPLQPAPVVTFDRIPLWGRVRPRHRVTRERNLVGLPPLQIVYLRVFENRARARTFVQGAWREFGYVHLLRSAASVSPVEFRRARRDGHLSDLVVGSEGRFRAQLAQGSEPAAPGWHRVRTVAGSAVTTYDRYGAYPVCAPMCTGAFWRRALDILLERADLVVLDLSGYARHFRGTQFELQRLVDAVPAEKVLLLADPWSRTGFLTDQVRLAWSRMAAGSPNAGRGQLTVRGAVTDHFHRQESGGAGSSSGSSGRSSSRLTLQASRRQTRRLLCDVQRRLPVGRPTGRPEPAGRTPRPMRDLPPHPEPAARAPRWPRVAAVLLVVAMAGTLLWQVVG